MELIENQETKGKSGVLDLRGMNVPLKQDFPKLNGKIPLKRGVSGRFERASNPPDYRGLIIQALIDAKFNSLEEFADEFGKSKGWAWMLINKPSKIRTTPEIQEQISRALGIKILL